MKEAIKVKSKEHGKKVVEYLISKGASNKNNRRGVMKGMYYFVDNDGSIWNSWYLPDGYTETFLPEEYPKEMWVWDDDEWDKRKRTVFGKFMGLYMVENVTNVFIGYRNASDIEEETDPLLEAYTEYSKSTDRCVNNCFDVYKAGYMRRMKEESELLSTVKPI